MHRVVPQHETGLASDMVTYSTPALVDLAVPVITDVSFAGLEATIQVTLPTKDQNGNPLSRIPFIRLFYGPSGSDLDAVNPWVIVGPWAAGSVQKVVIMLPDWETSYDFKAKVTS